MYYKGMRVKALTWPVAVVDVCCGSFVTAILSTLGLLTAQLDRADLAFVMAGQKREARLRAR
jgi:hypothetical protein